MISYTTCADRTDLAGILALQKANLIDILTPEEKMHQGFVTVSHTYDQLKLMNDQERHVIAKDGDKVVAYLLAMTWRSRAHIPALLPMFDIFEKMSYRGKLISDYDYMVVGQACVDKRYRGQGILDKCYHAYRTNFGDRYAFAVTEIAATNTRSQAAHKRIGFREIGRYTAPDHVEWSVVIWDWQSHL